MFSIERNECVLENVAKTIKYECDRRGFDYKEDEIKYLAIQQLVNPLGEFSGAHSNLDREINTLIDLCIDFLCDDHNIFCIKTISTQSYYLDWYKSKELVTENYQNLIREHTNPLVVDICQSIPRDNQQCENLYRKIVMAMLLLSGIGDATKTDYVVAAEVALKSVFPMKNMEGFVRLSYHNKLKELEDLKKTVTGIILYNEFKLNQCVISTQQSTLLEEGSKVVLEKLGRIASCLDSLTAVISWSLQDTVHFDSVHQDIMVVESGLFINNNNLHSVRSYLLLLQQCRRYVSTLMEDGRDCQQEFYRQEDEFQYLNRSLVSQLKGKVAITMNKVYSKFQEIGDVWTREQEICVVLNSIYDTLCAIMSFSEVHRMPECLRKLLGIDGPEPVDIEDLESHVTLRIEPTYYYTRIDPLLVQGTNKNVVDEATCTLEFNGFCPVYCVESGGFLLDARREIGVISYEGKHYGFRDVLAAAVFGKDPKKYIETVIEFARSNVEYVEILGLSDQVVKFRGCRISQNGEIRKAKKPVRDKEIQTEVHPMEKNIDKEYSWNLWEYRRRALQLADIVVRSTKSTQSYLSHFRESGWAQTYNKREKPSQTKVSTGCNTDVKPAETWCIRGKHPHIRLTSHPPVSPTSQPTCPPASPTKKS